VKFIGNVHVNGNGNALDRLYVYASQYVSGGAYLTAGEDKLVFKNNAGITYFDIDLGSSTMHFSATDSLQLGDLEGEETGGYLDIRPADGNILIDALTLNVGSIYVVPNTTVSITPLSTTQSGLIIKSLAAQSANPLKLVTSTDVLQFGVDASGQFTASGGVHTIGGTAHTTELVSVLDSNNGFKLSCNDISGINNKYWNLMSYNTVGATWHYNLTVSQQYGFVGVNQVNPQSMLHLKNKNTGQVVTMILENESGDMAGFQLGYDDTEPFRVIVPANYSFAVENGAGTALYISEDTDVRVGINTTSTTHALNVFGGSGFGEYLRVGNGEFIWGLNEGNGFLNMSLDSGIVTLQAISHVFIGDTNETSTGTQIDIDVTNEQIIFSNAFIGIGTEDISALVTIKDSNGYRSTNGIKLETTSTIASLVDTYGINVNHQYVSNQNEAKQYGGKFYTKSYPASNSYSYGVVGEAVKYGGYGQQAIGVVGKASHEYSIYNNPSTSLIGVQSEITMTGTYESGITIPNAYGLRTLVDLPATKTLTNYYGLYISAKSGSGTITNLYGIYQPESTAINYFNGGLAIGTTSLSGYKVNINGSLNCTAITVGGSPITSTFYREVTTLSTEVVAGTAVTIPNSRTYTVGANKLLVFVNGLLQYITDDYTESSTTAVTFTMDLPANTKILFQIFG